MVKSEILRKYELMLIVNAKLTQEEKDGIVKQVIEVANKVGAKIINNQIWQERVKLAFKIKKCNEGTYYLINFESNSLAIAELKQLLKLNEKVLRFLLLKQE